MLKYMNLPQNIQIQFFVLNIGIKSKLAIYLLRMQT